jgi:hypothetical protein
MTRTTTMGLGLAGPTRAATPRTQGAQPPEGHAEVVASLRETWAAVVGSVPPVAAKVWVHGGAYCRAESPNLISLEAQARAIAAFGSKMGIYLGPDTLFIDIGSGRMSDRPGLAAARRAAAAGSFSTLCVVSMDRLSRDPKALAEITKDLDGHDVGVLPVEGWPYGWVRIGIDELDPAIAVRRKARRAAYEAENG